MNEAVFMGENTHQHDIDMSTCAGNIGDALQYASDDRLKSTYHRVRVPKNGEYQVKYAPGPTNEQDVGIFHCLFSVWQKAMAHRVILAVQGDRYSMAYFANVRDSTVLQGPLKKYPGRLPRVRARFWAGAEEVDRGDTPPWM